MINNFWDFIVYVFWTFAYIAYLFAVVLVIIDLFRDHKLNGWFKALWIIFLVFVPFLTVLVYIIARGRGMAERSERRVQRMSETEDAEILAARPAPSPAAEIATAQDLLDKGIITAGEFDALKNKALGGKY